jgi:hypothetical protein
MVIPGAAPAERVTFDMLGLTHPGAGPFVDGDAFEFAWVKLPDAYGDMKDEPAFGVLFSVGADKPATAMDESGMLAYWVARAYAPVINPLASRAAGFSSSARICSISDSASSRRPTREAIRAKCESSARLADVSSMM